MKRDISFKLWEEISEKNREDLYKGGATPLGSHRLGMLSRIGVLESGIPFLQKPFTPDALLRKELQALDAPPKGAVTPENKDIAIFIR